MKSSIKDWKFFFMSWYQQWIINTVSFRWNLFCSIESICSSCNMTWDISNFWFYCLIEKNPSYLISSFSYDSFIGVRVVVCSRFDYKIIMIAQVWNYVEFPFHKIKTENIHGSGILMRSSELRLKEWEENSAWKI